MLNKAFFKKLKTYLRSRFLRIRHDLSIYKYNIKQSKLFKKKANY